ncbi:nuclear transport factor 2 family protein [Flavobacterium sp. ASW18X]|uniref:nuclear transport factor 2 family protein n=1 Tax=Flavobacterium sp. ASW18X TaxID=2572595 RepID=UPI0010AE4032|nr:nuclear transport factor 2 family protein [Flavobacterium sp. ASW18X]TKD58974.1 nuclear transport factor 2 family protein [Flavobacterium sp. ASW18X]
MRNVLGLFLILISTSVTLQAQTKQDSIEIKQVALDYLVSQHTVKPELFERSAHPRMVKRTFWKNRIANKEYLRETFKDGMVLLAETYNVKGDKFPENPTKEVVLLDVYDKVASVKLVADEWIDYMHIVKLNGEWQIVNVLWQFKDGSLH